MTTTSDSAARKAAPICTGVLDYFPDAIEAIARLSKKGNDKHNPGQPLHWSRELSNDHADCLLRHQKDRGTIDPETGELHEVAVAWRALAQLQLAEERRKGARPPQDAFVQNAPVCEFHRCTLCGARGQEPFSADHQINCRREECLR